jgi:MFS family permease
MTPAISTAERRGLSSFSLPHTRVGADGLRYDMEQIGRFSLSDGVQISCGRGCDCGTDKGGRHLERRRVWLLLAIALGVLLNPLNSSMISVAIARFQHAFQLSFAAVSWIISTYYLASAIAQPVMGRVADLVGHKKMFLLGLAVVALSSLTAPLAPSFAWLIGFRLIQAVGSSVLYPAGMAIVRHRVRDGQAQALAFLAVFSSGAAAFGPTIGGLLLHWHDWPAIFIINIPIIIVGFILALWALPKDAPRRTVADIAPVDGAAAATPSDAGRNTLERSRTEGDAATDSHTTAKWQHLLGNLDIPGILLFALAVIWAPHVPAVAARPNRGVGGGKWHP